MATHEKRPDIELTELGSGPSPEPVSDDDVRLGDPFLEDFYSSASPFSDWHNVITEPAASKSQIQLLDVYKGPAKNEYSCELQDSSFSTLKLAVPEQCQIRIIFIKKATLNHRWHRYFSDEFRAFSQQYSIPAAFWNQEGVGSAGQRRASSKACGESGDTWLSILQKLSEGRTSAWRWSAFLLKQHDPAARDTFKMPQITFICFGAPRDLRRRIYHAFNSRTPAPETVDGVLSDPFRLLLLVIMAWYHWNTKVFWALTHTILGLEHVNGIKGTGLWRSETAGYAFMHLLTMDVIQTAELLEVSLKIIQRLKALHERSFRKFENGALPEALEQTRAALDHHFLRFEGVRERVQALLKRISNQISLTFHLGQQREAKTAQGSSDSIKTISILTLLFLPATGIATIFSTPFFHPSDTGFKIHISPSFIFYWALTIPTTLITMAFWVWWSVKRKPSSKEGALHSTAPTPQPKSLITSLRGRKMKSKDSGKMDLEQRIYDKDRPHSPHFWDYSPNWPWPPDENYSQPVIDSDDE